MGIDSFKSDNKQDSSKDTSSCNKESSEVNQYGKSGKYDDSTVKTILRKCNDETQGNNISRSDYKSWRENIDRDTPSASWFYRNGGWNSWLEKAGLELNRRGTEVSFEGSIDDMSDSKAYVIGVLIGDGSVITDKGQHKIQLSATDSEFVKKFGDNICNFTGLDSDELTKGETEEQYYVAKMSKELALEMDKFKKSNWDKWVKDMSMNNLKHLLTGLYESEGTYNSGKCIFTTTDIEVKNLFFYCIIEVLDLEFSYPEVRRKSIGFGPLSIQEYFREERSVVEYQIILSKDVSKRFRQLTDVVISEKVGD